MTFNRFQIRFTKTGLLRWISHRDLARLWERMVRRCELRLAMSEGFSPKPKISFPSALALGVESEDEVVEMTLRDSISVEELWELLRRDGTEGMAIKQVLPMEKGTPKCQFAAASYAYFLPEAEPPTDSEIEQQIHQLIDEGKITFHRKGVETQADLDEQVVELRISNRVLTMTLKGSRTASLRPTDVLASLGIDHLMQCGARLLRTKTHLEHESDSESSVYSTPHN